MSKSPILGESQSWEFNLGISVSVESWAKLRRFAMQTRVLLSREVRAKSPPIRCKFVAFNEEFDLTQNLRLFSNAHKRHLLAQSSKVLGAQHNTTQHNTNTCFCFVRKVQLATIFTRILHLFAYIFAQQSLHVSAKRRKQSRK